MSGDLSSDVQLPDGFATECDGCLGGEAGVRVQPEGLEVLFASEVVGSAGAPSVEVGAAACLLGLAGWVGPSGVSRGLGLGLVGSVPVPRSDVRLVGGFVPECDGFFGGVSGRLLPGRAAEVVGGLSSSVAMGSAGASLVEVDVAGMSSCSSAVCLLWQALLICHLLCNLSIYMPPSMPLFSL